MKTIPVTVLFIIILALAIAFVGAPGVVFAQQSTLEQPAAIAQGDAPKDAVKVAVPDTPEKFKPVIGKWEFNAGSGYITTFTINDAKENGKLNVDYWFRKKKIDPSSATVEKVGGKELQVVIQVGSVKWELSYSDTSGGMLSGTLYLPGQPPNNSVRFYREK